MQKSGPAITLFETLRPIQTLVMFWQPSIALYLQRRRSSYHNEGQSQTRVLTYL